MWGEPKFISAMAVLIVDPYDAETLRWKDKAGLVRATQLTPQGWRYKVEIRQVRNDLTSNTATVCEVWTPWFSEAELQGISDDGLYATWTVESIVDGETDE